ncbi:MAG: carboxypeptidase-like regulatory domain-containing protein [Terriglobales bacterium]
MRRIRLIVGGALCFAALSVALPAVLAHGAERGKPSPYALIFGTVWDPDGHPLYAVQVKIRRADQKKARWELYSDHNGEFAQRVPVGPADYIVWADVKRYKLDDGRKLQAGTEVKVHIDGDERSDIGLHLSWR